MKGTRYFEILSYSRESPTDEPGGRREQGIAGRSPRLTFFNFQDRCSITGLCNIPGGTFVKKHSMTTEAILMNGFDLVMSRI